jgi:hypothetical protein
MLRPVKVRNQAMTVSRGVLGHLREAITDREREDMLALACRMTVHDFVSRALESCPHAIGGPGLSLPPDGLPSCRESRTAIQQINTATSPSGIDLLRPRQASELHQRPVWTFMPLVHTEEVVWPAGLPAIQTFITGIPPLRRNRLWLHRRTLHIPDKIPFIVPVAVNRSPCHLHTPCIAPAHARVAVL